MSDAFFNSPILNSPYEEPVLHWELDDTGQPTSIIVPRRRQSALVSPIPKAKKVRGKAVQPDLLADESGQEYNPTEVINGIRSAVDSWRRLPESQWQVTATTARLLRHWRMHEFANQRPFFCQVEAVETVIWLTEVAPRSSSQGRRFWTHLEAANAASNPELMRMALKLATGAGKTTVMAMLIAWQTLNAVRHPNAKRFSKGFLVIAPGITIKDRLRVLQPNDPESYYKSREIVPDDMLLDLGRAKIVITNFHAFKKKDEVALNKVQQAALRTAPKPESDGAMIRRVAGELMGLKNIVVLNDEAHHCYRERPLSDEEMKALKGDELAEAKQANEAARLWISGIEAVKRELGVSMVYDLSATPFFLRGSGYREGSLFGWVMSDFSLMDAIECGIVKLPRVPVMDNVTGGDTPMFRNLWEHVGKQLPKKGRGSAKGLDPQKLPNELLTAIDALYGHYEKTHALWREAGIGVDPVFIVVCNNTATSKLVHDYIAGYEITDDDGNVTPIKGKCALFRNFDPDGTALPRMRTLLIDSQQLESGEAISAEFRDAAKDEITRFKDELIQRTGDRAAADKIDDATILREVMNTVGRKGQLGEGIRCVVSVSMLTEGWDANTVTHVLGIRAFGTQLLCEQVIGRALRRQSYQLQADGKFRVEYADVLGIPFDFTAQPVISKPSPPDNMERVHAISPARDQAEIRYPRVEGYRTELPSERLTASFSPDSTLELTPELVGATETINSGIIGETADLTIEHLADTRAATIHLKLAEWIVKRRMTNAGERPNIGLILQTKTIVRQWMAEHLVLAGGTQPAQLLYYNIADRVADRIMAAITRGQEGGGRVLAMLDPYNKVGSTRHVSFMTSKDRYATSDRCHINYAVLDSDWEAEFCRVADKHASVLAWVKNHNLGFEVPYSAGGEARRYRPDFILRINDGRGPEDPLHLVVEIKGARDEDDKDKAETMRTLWVPGVNALGEFGRWGFAEFTDVWADGIHSYLTYLLADSREGQMREAEVTRSLPADTPTYGRIRQGFVYKRVPHITLKSIANNAEIDTIWEAYQERLEPLRAQINAALGTDWQEWQIPRELTAQQSAASAAHAAWWEQRIARQKEIDASIAAKAETEYLYDQPYEDKTRVRVAGPFTVESLSPHRVPAIDVDDSLFDEMEAAGGRRQPGAASDTADFAAMVLDNLKRSGVQQAHKADRLVFASLKPWPGRFICAEGAVRQASEGESDTLADSPTRRAAIFIGPEYGTVARADLTAAAREAMEAGFDLLIAASFNFDAHASEFDRMGALTVLQARINPDLHMPDLANTGAGNLFTVFGEPDIQVHEEDDGCISIEVAGVDMYKGGEIVSGDADDIAVWFIDTDYNYESFFVRHAYFPGANDPYKALKTTLKAEIDADAWESLKRTRSRPFPRPAGGKVAVKVINHLGDEVMKVVGV